MNTTNTKTIIIFIIALVVILAGVIFLTAGKAKGEELVPFAQCLKDKNIKFYGAFWCPHCQATKRLFGAAAKELPYIECSTPDGNGQLQICKDKGITNYPTWIFPDESRLMGEQTLEALSEKSSCPLPTATQ